MDNVGVSASSMQSVQQPERDADERGIKAPIGVLTRLSRELNDRCENLEKKLEPILLPNDATEEKHGDVPTPSIGSPIQDRLYALCVRVERTLDRFALLDQSIDL